MATPLSNPPRGFVTPSWAVLALLPHIQHLADGLEPAAGQGAISRILLNKGMRVTSFDLYPYEGDGVVVNKRNFLSSRWDDQYKSLRQRIKEMDGGIISHPPRHLAGRFIKQALKLTAPRGTTAFWLSSEIDRDYKLREFFSESDTFYKKIVPIQRLRLLDDGQEPMAWYVWRGGYGGAPSICYEVI